MRRAWDVWWRDRDEFEDCRLPRKTWKFHGLRLANHPQRRLGLASHWLVDKNFISTIQGWGAAGLPDRRLVDRFMKFFRLNAMNFGRGTGR
jgi:hypothetical protein